MKSIAHLILSLILGVFFMYAGIKKFIPKERPVNPNAKIELVNAVQNDVYENPVPFKLTVKMLSTSGFLKMVGILQILSGLMIIIPKTRLGGLIFLLPITINVCCMHFFMDNRMDENIETGLFLALNIVLLLAYRKKLASLFDAKIN